MSDLGVGNQQTKPEDLQQKDAAINGAIDGAVKHSMSSFTSAMNMMKTATRGSDFGAVMSLGAQQRDPVLSNNKSDSLTSFGSSRRKKGTVTLSQQMATHDLFGHKLDRNVIKSKYALLNAAWVGKAKGMRNGSGANARDFVEEMNLLKMRMAGLKDLLKDNKGLLRGFGMGQIYDAHTSVQAEKEKPHTDAVISGTLSDMDQFKDKFKGLDSGLQQQVMANGGAQVKQKLKPLLAAPQAPQAPGQSQTT